MRFFLLGFLLFSGTFSFAESAKKVQPCNSLFTSQFSDKKDRDIASVEQYGEVIADSVANEQDPNRLRYLAGYLLSTTSMRDADREKSLYVLAAYLKKWIDVKKFEADCLSGKASELFNKK